MPDWQGELESLLATLNVSLEGPPRGMTPEDEAERATVAPDEADEADHAERLLEVVPVEGDEVSAVRSEIEATVGQVVALVRAGRMDLALRDDVIFVLNALTRPRPSDRSRPKRPVGTPGPDDSTTEWNLASAAAILRFCRIVLRLTNSIWREDDDL